MYERDDGITAGGEEAAEAEMDAGEYAVPHVALQVLAAKGDDTAVAREYSYGIFRNELENNRGDGAEAHRDRY